MKITKTLLICISVNLFACIKSEGQKKHSVVSEKIIKTKESYIEIKEDNVKWLFSIYVGNDFGVPVFYMENNDQQRKFSLVNENKEETDIYKFPDSLFISKNAYYFSIFNKYVFYKNPIYNFNDETETDVGFSNLILSDGNHNYIIDSVYNADKKNHSSFSADGKYLLINTLNSLSDYYNEEQDNRTLVVDIDEFEKTKIIKKQYLACDKCSHSYKRGDKLFFNKGRLDGYDGYTNRDIYVAPWGNIKDTTKLASNISIIDVTPDGKYILGTRFFDRQKNTLVILEVATKKYQMLIGRDYHKYVSSFFYSRYMKKFAFLDNKNLVYIDFPKTYPFDALNWKNEEIPDFTDEIWKNYEHPPLK